MKCELFTIYNIKTLSNKQLSFLDKSKAEQFAKGKGDWGGDLLIIPEQILIVDGVNYFKVTSVNSEELKNDVERAKLMSRLSESEMKGFGVVVNRKASLRSVDLC